MKIIAVVVTYNRLELLKKNIACLRLNKPLNSIVVVDNGCTDGTREWIDSQSDLHVIHQENVGGSGGFYTGMRYVFEQTDADWIWCMDDDVFPHPACLEELMKATRHPSTGIVAPRRLMDGHVFSHEFRAYNLTNPFTSMYKGRLSKEMVNAPTEVKGIAFEGPLIKREVVKAIGYPNKDLFIFCDDTDYSIRTVLAGYTIWYIPSALMDKQQFFSDTSWSERNRKKKWKRFYQIRNAAYLNHHYGKTWAVKYIRSFNAVLGYLLIAFFTAPFSKAYVWKDIPRLWKAYRDGVKEKLGKY